MNLEYKPSYHLHCGLSLNCGRAITLEALQQKTTYAGLLEGTPIPRINDSIIEGVLENARNISWAGTRPHLVVPPRRDYLRTPGDMSSDRMTPALPQWVPEWLPLVTCIGTFKSVSPARDASKDLSVLTVVWFQDEFALPIKEPAFTQLKALDWATLAADVEY